ncbi:MAG: hypothetical protein HZB46_17110 [Solirubrobacterales bacterium]|nr:hypothetical protein [Solirubrobacterales bacterium]
MSRPLRGVVVAAALLLVSCCIPVAVAATRPGARAKPTSPPAGVRARFAKCARGYRLVVLRGRIGCYRRGRALRRPRCAAGHHHVGRGFDCVADATVPPAGPKPGRPPAGQKPADPPKADPKPPTTVPANWCILLGTCPSPSPDPPAPPEPPAPPPPPASPAKVYQGTLDLDVHYFTICGQDLGTLESKYPAKLSLAPPSGRETNPFNLVLDRGTGTGTGGHDGVELLSAMRITNTGGVLQYWDLRLDGTSLSGELVDEHRAEASAANLLYSPKDLIECQLQFGMLPFAWAIKKGTTLAGTVTETSAQVTITGNVVGDIRPFTATLTATRDP